MDKHMDKDVDAVVDKHMDKHMDKDMDAVMDAVMEHNRHRLLIRIQDLKQMNKNKLTARNSAGDEDPIEDNGRTAVWQEECFQLVLDYNHIKDIFIDPDGCMFFRLVYPPLIYKICDQKDFNACENYYDDDFDAFQDEKMIDSHVEEKQNEPQEYDDNEAECHLSDNKKEPQDIYEETQDWMREDDSFLDNESDSCMETESDLLEYRLINDSNCEKDAAIKKYSGFRLRVNSLNDMNPHSITKSNAIKLQMIDANILEEIISNVKSFFPAINVTRSNFKNMKARNEVFDIPKDLPFNVIYALQALIEYSYHFTDSFNSCADSYIDFISSLRELTLKNASAVENALFEMQTMSQNCDSIKPTHDFIQLFAKFNACKANKWQNKDIIRVRRCVLTPTRILLLPPLPLQQSRFLRICDPDFAIRLLIRDENLESLSFTCCKTSLPERHSFTQEVAHYLDKCIRDKLLNGVQIGGREYHVLGASTSQLRDHGIVLYAKDNLGRCAEDIRNKIGALKSISNPAKFIARIGMSMSQCMGHMKGVTQVQFIDDIKGGQHPISGDPFTFSDGVGMISPLMANKLANSVNCVDKKPSTFQIRYAGVKGILVVNPELNGEQIKIRPSMKKFESNSTDLDVLKVSEPRCLFLNRPLIAILEDMQVPKSNILKLQFDCIKRLLSAFKCDCKALQIIRDFSTLKLPFKQLLASGINILNEPFFVNAVEAIIKKASTDLKNKARILIPMNEGRVMFGVLDETNTLEYGQVFVQYTNDEDGSKKIITDEVLVTKYPCMHGGDVRKFTAIDVPSLHHIYDSIVFPAKGKRPHPDEMAGSDLDGDEYSVIWNKDLIFKRENYEPMNFPCHKTQDLGSELTTKDILEFYRCFIQNNDVGLIANSHLVFSDSSCRGIFSGLCAQLGFKYAIALDFAKTGINARLRGRERPLRYPDFMMKHSEKPTYRSDKVLGKLYQNACYFQGCIKDVALHYNQFYTIDEKLLHPDAEKYFDDARVMFDMYKNAVMQLKTQFGIESEATLITGSYAKTHKYFNTRSENNDIQDLVANIIDKLFADFREKFEYEFVSNEDEEQKLAKASAWYKITADMNSSSKECDKYYGLPWIVSHYLSKLATQNKSSKHFCASNQFILQSNEKKIGSNAIDAIIRKIIRCSYREELFLSDCIPDKIKIYLKETVNKQLIDNNIEARFFEAADFGTILMDVLQALVDRVDSLEDDDDQNNRMICKIGLIALVSIYRLSTMKNLSQLLIKRFDDEENQMTLSLAITENLAKLISFSEEKFISVLKAKTGINQVLIRYGHDSYDSMITASGTKIALQKFEAFMIEPLLHKDIESSSLFLSNP